MRTQASAKIAEVRCELHGHPVRVTTLDLGQVWEKVHRHLLALLDPAV